jgi:WD40 repeat protein
VRTLVVPREQGEARLWDAVTGQRKSVAMPHHGSVHSVAFSPDGKTLLTGSVDQTTRLWDTATGQPVGLPLCHQEGIVRAAVFSPDGRQIATASADRTARLWHLTGQPAGPPLVHKASVIPVAFSPDGRLVATGSFDRTARLWDARTGLPVGPPFRHPLAVFTLAFSPDGTTLLSGGPDRTVRFWQVPSPAPGTVERLKLWAEAISGLTLSSEGVVGRLDGPAWQERLAALERQGDPFGPLPQRSIPWHLHEAQHCLEAENWDAAVWHLDRRLGEQPNDWLAHVLRTRAHVACGRLQEAAADLTRAFRLGDAETVVHCYRSYAAWSADAGQWPAAVWYLDRLLEVRPRDELLQALRAQYQEKP